MQTLSIWTHLYIRRSWSGHRESNPHRELLFSRSNSASPKFRHASKSRHYKTFRLRRATGHTTDDCRCVECHGRWCESAERSQTFGPERRFLDFAAGIGRGIFGRALPSHCRPSSHRRARERVIGDESYARDHHLSQIVSRIPRLHTVPHLDSAQPESPTPRAWKTAT